MAEPLTIEQGTTRTIAVDDIVDDDGDALDVTGWTVHAMIRRTPREDTVLAEWHTSPTGEQGTAEADSDGVRLLITPAMSSAWTWTHAELHIEITEPAPGERVERIGDRDVILDLEIVRP